MTKPQKKPSSKCACVGEQMAQQAGEGGDGEQEADKEGEEKEAVHLPP